MPKDELLVDRRDDIMTLQLNRPDKLHAVTSSLVDAMESALKTAETEARAVVITGSDRAFCSGADLSSGAAGNDGIGLDRVNSLIRRITDLRIPTVAAVSGPAVGFGCSLALACDYVIMAEESYFLLSFTRVGLMPDSGASALVAASAGRHRALRMALTAERIDAHTALEWGLAAEVTAPGEQLARAQDIGAQFASGPPLSLGWTKKAINMASLNELENAFSRESAGQFQLHETYDFKEGVSAFKEKRSPKFTGV